MTDRASGCGPSIQTMSGLRLRRRSHLQWAEISHAEHHRRVYAECLAIRVNRKLNSRMSSMSCQTCSLCAVSRACSFRQWPRFRRQSRPDWIGAVAPRPPISSLAALGKRLLRKLQLEASRRATRWRDFLYLGGSQSDHRKLASLLQRNSAALIARLQATSPAGPDAGAPGCAT